MTLLLVAEVLTLLLAPAPETLSFRHRGWPTVALALFGAASVTVPSIWFAGARLTGGRFQVGLRAVIVLIACLAIPPARLSGDIARAQTYQTAVAAVEKIGGNVMDDYKSELWRYNADVDSRPMLVALLGSQRYLAFVTPQPHIVDVMFTDGASPASFLPAFDGLEELSFHFAGDDDARHISKLQQLRYLLIRGGALDDSGLSPFSALKDLRIHSLGNVLGGDIHFASRDARAVYQTYDTPAGSPSLFGPNYDRLPALKTKHDPTNFFRRNANIARKQR